jgi:hypothetical protein
MNKATKEIYKQRRKKAHPAYLALRAAKAQTASYTLELPNNRVFRIEYPISATKKELEHLAKVIGILGFD